MSAGKVFLAGLLAASMFATTIPRKSPEFVIVPPDGKQILLSSYHGKVACFLFILTTCPHCQKAVQDLTAIQNELGPKGFAVLAGTINENPNIPEFIQRFHPSFPVGEANKLGAWEYMQMDSSKRPPFLPYMVFIDRKGTIRAQYAGPDKILDSADSEQQLRTEALKYLNETSPAKPKVKHTATP